MPPLRLAASLIAAAVGVTAFVLAVMALRQFGAGVWGVAFLLCLIAAAAWAGAARMWPRRIEDRPPGESADGPVTPQPAEPAVNRDEPRPPQ